MNPRLSLRSLAAFLCESSPTDCPRTTAVPSEGPSSDPMMFSIVVFPDPDGPTRPANSPVLKLRSIPFRAVKAAKDVITVDKSQIRHPSEDIASIEV